MNNKNSLTVCYFGTYSLGEGYSRNRMIIEGLKSIGVKVVECHEKPWLKKEDRLKFASGNFFLIKRFWRLIVSYTNLVRKFRIIKDYDVIIVGYTGHIDVFLAKLLNIFRKKPLIFDAFLSLYDTSVNDRKLIAPKSLKAKLLKLIDTWSCKIADDVLLDTKCHIDYFVKKFNLPIEKFYAVPVGSVYSLNDINNSYKASSGLLINSFFNVLYFGSFIPLHGVDIILKAAKIIQTKDDSVGFTLIGLGQMLEEMKELASSLKLKNTLFISRYMGYDELLAYIQSADICLGVFGSTEKASRVIPCKAYDCLAAGKPLITAMTPATAEILSHEENAYLCPANDYKALAKSILMLKNDKKLLEKLASNSKKFYDYNFSLEKIGQIVVKLIEEVQ